MKTSDSDNVNILILGIHQDLGEKFAQDVCGGAESRKIGEYQVSLDVLAGDPRLNAAWDDTLQTAGGIILLTRFLDVISLDKIKAIYRRLPSENAPPLLIVILRENGEADFKMSCPVCGQKLWVRDSDAGKRGRCPNCKKAFMLPDQVNHIRAQLALPDSLPVERVIGGEADSAVAAVERLLQTIDGGLIEAPEGLDQDVLKQSTIRVQINPDEV